MFLKLRPLLVLFFILLFCAQAVYLAYTNSAIYDEKAHITAGYSYLKYHDFRLNPEHPPFIKQLAALPLTFMDLKFPLKSDHWNDHKQWELGRAFLFNLGNPGNQMIFWARLALLPLALLFAFSLFAWTRDLFGYGAALFALALYSMFPELIFHASVVGTDFGAATFFFTTFYFLFRFHKNQNISDLLFCGLFSGFALATKFSMIQIIPLFYLFSLVLALSLKREQLRHVKMPLWGLVLTTFFVVFQRSFVEIVILPLLFLWLARFFPKNSTLHQPKLLSSANLLMILMALMLLVIALDYFEPTFWFEKFRPFKRFFRGWGIFRGHARAEQHLGYFFGHVSHEGNRLYYLTAMLVKIPLPILISFVIGIIYFFRTTKLNKTQLSILLLPPLLYFFIASFINKVNIGVRHALPLYPYILIFAGGCAAAFSKVLSKPKHLKALIPIVMSLWLAIVSFSAFPNYLSYFNEIALFFGGGDKILSDSNITWGQDLKRLRKHLDHHSIQRVRVIFASHSEDELNYYGIPFEQGQEHLSQKTPGIYAIDVMTYQKLVPLTVFKWLAETPPKAHIGGSLKLYEIRQDLTR